MLKRSSTIHLGTLALGSKLSSTIAIILECSCGVCRKCFTPQIHWLPFNYRPFMAILKVYRRLGVTQWCSRKWRLTKVSVYCYHVVSRWAVLIRSIQACGSWYESMLPPVGPTPCQRRCPRPTVKRTTRFGAGLGLRLRLASPRWFLGIPAGKLEKNVQTPRKDRKVKFHTKATVDLTCSICLGLLRY